MFPKQCEGIDTRLGKLDEALAHCKVAKSPEMWDAEREGASETDPSPCQGEDG